MEDTFMPSKVLAVLDVCSGAEEGEPLAMQPLGDMSALEQLVKRMGRARFGKSPLVLTDYAPGSPVDSACRRMDLRIVNVSAVGWSAGLLEAARTAGAEYVVRCSLGNPFPDPRMLDACVLWAMQSGMDFVTVHRLPEGVGAEAFPVRTLERTAELSRDIPPAELVMSRPDLFEAARLPVPPRLCRPELSFCLNSDADYRLLHRLYAEVPAGQHGIIPVEAAIAWMDCFTSGSQTFSTLAA